MRRVVVTGMGIVSSIGNNTQEVLASLREAKSGVVRAEDYARLGFRCQVHGAPKLDLDAAVDRRVRRFMGDGAAWNWVAMQQAITDVRPRGDRTSRTSGPASSWDRAVPRRRPSSPPPTPRVRRARSGSGRSRFPPPCRAPTRRRSPSPFGIRGVNYSISSACATSSHCIGNSAELIQWGKQDVMFAGGGEELDWTLSVLFDAMGAMSTHFNETPAKASRAYDKNRDGFVIAGGAGVVVLEELAACQGARRQDLWRSRGLRRDVGRLRHGSAFG